MSGETVHADDWACNIPDTDHNRFFKSFDWSRTLLGPRSEWSLALRLYVQQVFTDCRPACVYWGPELVAIYNEDFMPLVGQLHPTLMGTPFAEAFPTLINDIHPLFEATKLQGHATRLSDQQMFVNRNGFLEETFFNGSFNPLREADGTIQGFYNSTVEVTRQNLTDRRRRMLNLISSFTEDSQTKKVWQHIIECLDTNRLDIPVTLLYQVVEESEIGDHLLKLRGSLGLPPSHKFLIHEARLNDGDGLIPLLLEARTKEVTVEATQEWGDIEWAGFGEPSKHITAIPILNAGRMLGFLIIANNPRRPLDPDHEQFVQDVSRQLSWTIATTLAIEESIKREQRLQDQLAESERQIRYMAQHSDIGMQHLSLDGKLIWANEHYHTMAEKDGNAKDLQQHKFWYERQVLEEDYDKVKSAWLQVLQGHKTHLLEIRLKRKYYPHHGDPVAATMLLSAFPYMKDGQVQSIMACMTDVSRLKWAESWQARIAQEASEAKRQQGEYIDVISHEVRNPLSAILQLADSIASSTDSGKVLESTKAEFLNVLKDIAEAAKMILTCAQHQKRIVDDVLTLSKMDFELMTLTPSSAQPARLVADVVRILGADSSVDHVKIHLSEDSSLKSLTVDRVICDSLRLTQILINILTNALKFTRRQARRDVHVRYGATLSEPRESFPIDVRWAAPKRTVDDITLDPLWGLGETLYLTFRVDDTGPGMTSEELERLFNRFEQATPKTSIKYGGTGLGLFISHTLTEKQSGSIGVFSEVGKGSTFAFYIKVRRALDTTPAASNKTLNSTSRSDVFAKPSASSEDSIPVRVISPGSGPNSSVDAGNTPKSKSANSTDKSVQTNSLEQTNYNILLVEDNLINQKVLKRQLEKAGCTVLVANHGKEALDILPETTCWKQNEESGTRLDIILMDWEMPIMDGLTCSKEIRSLEYSGQMQGHIEIIATTANVRQEQQEKIKAAGADMVMPKPFKVSELLELIKKRLDKGQPPRASLTDVDGYQGESDS